MQVLLVTAVGSNAWAAGPVRDPSDGLRGQYTALGERLQRSPWGQPLVIVSGQEPNRLKGDIYAVVDHAFADVNRGLGNPDNWCDVVTLHPNTKYCRAASGPWGATLQVRIGTSSPQKIEDAALVALSYRTVATTPEYARLELISSDGPLGTSDYRIRFEALALPDNKSFVHLTYSYTINLAARLVLQTYLGTLARNKVGFTSSAQSDGKPRYLGGLLGHLERNTMRYFLAIDAYLQSAGAPAPERFERRLQAWFNASERYPRQLHELERDVYLQMKRDENLRQRRVNAGAETARARP